MDPAPLSAEGTRFGRPERPSEAFGRRRVRDARVAVSAIFFQQGLLVGAWSLHIPILIERLGIDKTIMGGIIVAFGLGSIAAMLVLGPFIGRHGSRKATIATAFATSFFLLLISITPGLAATVVAVVFIGASIGAVDVAMNAQAVEVERRARRAIMSSFHAYWSMGTLAGALVSGWLILRMGALGQAALVTFVSLGIAALSMRFLVRERVTLADASASFSIPRAPAVWLLGIVCLFAYVVEGASIDWSAVFMRDEVRAPFAVAGWALAALQVTMMIARFAGDGIRDRFGAVRTLRWGGLLAAVGFAVAGSGGLEWAADWPVEGRTALVIAGFLICGLGLANIVPIAFAASGHITGVPPAVALSLIAMFGYAGILLAPSGLGWLGDRFGLAVVFISLAALPAIAALMAGAARRPS